MRFDDTLIHIGCGIAGTPLDLRVARREGTVCDKLAGPADRGQRLIGRVAPAFRPRRRKISALSRGLLRELVAKKIF